MKFHELKLILTRLYKEYINKHLSKILLALVLSVIVAGSTSAIAWLLDPAVKKVFIDQNTTLAWLIPLAIIFAFSAKGLSLYFARINIIRVGQEIAGTIQKQIADNEYIYVSSYNPTRNQAYNFSHELFDKNKLIEKISARNIRWVDEDSIFRLTDFFKRSFVNESEIIESRRIYDTLFNFNIEDLSSLKYQAKALSFFELNKFINEEKASGSPLLNNHLLERNRRLSIPFSVLILTLLAVSVSSFKKPTSCFVLKL